MTSAVIVILSILSLTVLSAIGRYISYRNGEKSERLKNAETTNEAIRKGNSSINRADNDDELAMRLHDKYNLRE